MKKFEPQTFGFEGGSATNSAMFYFIFFLLFLSLFFFVFIFIFCLLFCLLSFLNSLELIIFRQWQLFSSKNWLDISRHKKNPKKFQIKDHFTTPVKQKSLNKVAFETGANNFFTTLPPQCSIVSSNCHSTKWSKLHCLLQQGWSTTIL
jgi:hypothetical protein